MSNDFFELALKLIVPELCKTLFMVLATGVCATALGFTLAIILVLTDKDGMRKPG